VHAAFLGDAQEMGAAPDAAAVYGP